MESTHAEYLCIGRADPFVMALLPAAMRGGHEIVCEDAMSERLHHQLCGHVIPALAFAGELYHMISSCPSLWKSVPPQTSILCSFA